MSKRKSNCWRGISHLAYMSLLLAASWAQAQPLDAAESADSGTQATPTTSLKVMTWNIWHGGREDGKQTGPQRVIDVIRDSNADIVAMQETYGSGEIIAQGLKYHFHPRGTNLSIHSRFPVIEDISVFEEFKCVGALIELPDGNRVAFYSIWLPYRDDIWLPLSRDTFNDQDLVDKCNVSRDDLKQILSAIDAKLSAEAYSDVPVIIAGDFNSMSHLDYVPHAREQYQFVVPWPTSRAITNAGFRDSYREANPVIDRRVDATWSPKFIEQEQDRIDFIYYKSPHWRAVKSKVIRQHDEWFPSDHAAVVTEFRKFRKADLSPPLKVLTYNIKHGIGTDQQQFLMRTAKAIRRLDADIVGLQEVDQNCRRSGRVNQIAALARQLKRHGAFGKFMDYDEGEYGMGLLSKYPIIDVQSIELPAGGEPRIALAAKIRLPNDSEIMAINVHFDWVDDDKIRFQQATVVANYLKNLDLPFVLLGDFNDRPGSRTLRLFQELAVECQKPDEARMTFSSVAPEQEIDFLFVSPKPAWSVLSTQVVDEPITSDHLPVITRLQLTPNSK